MMKNSRFSLIKWLSGSLIGIILANIALICFVTATDVFLGQPPQFGVPLFALLVASGALILGRRIESHKRDTCPGKIAVDSPKYRRRSGMRKSSVPAYFSMTIIKRQPASASYGDEQKGAIH